MGSKIVIHKEDKKSIYEQASEFLIYRLKFKSINTQKTLMLLSGGSAVKIYNCITYYVSGLPAGRQASEAGIKYKNIAFAQADERFCPEGTKQAQSSKLKAQSQEENINAYQIEKTGLWKVCEKKGIPYFIISQDGSLQESAEQYNMILEKLFQEYPYKIAILGVGEDGHTAGLLPGYEKIWNIDKHAIGYDLGQNRPRGLFCQFRNGWFRYRITLTPKAFKQVDQAIVVVTGENKKGVIRRLLNDNFKPDLDTFPASLIKSIPGVDLFYDKIIV